MAISLIADSSAKADFTTTAVVPVPTGPLDDDIIIFFTSSNRVFLTPAGFIELVNEDFSSNFLTLGYRKASSEPASYTFTASGGTARGIVMLATYRGQDLTSPIDLTNFSEGGADETAVMNDTTPSQADSLVFVGVGPDRGNDGDPIIGSTTTGLTVQLDNVNGPQGNSNNSASGAYADEIQVGAPTTVSGNFSLTMNSGATAWQTIALVVAPEVADDSGVASAAGTSEALGVGVTIIEAEGNAAGTSEVLGVAPVLELGVGSSAGVATVSGVAEAIFNAVANAAGLAVVLGEGLAGAGSTANAQGTSEALAIGVGGFEAVALAQGFATVEGVGLRISPDAGAGLAEGTSLAEAVSSFTEKALSGGVRGGRGRLRKRPGRAFIPQAPSGGRIILN